MLSASLQRGKTILKECPGYDNKPSDGENTAYELW